MQRKCGICVSLPDTHMVTITWIHILYSLMDKLMSSYAGSLLKHGESLYTKVNLQRVKSDFITIIVLNIQVVELNCETQPICIIMQYVYALY